MKMDVDTILYIIITLAILVISGLSGRRKKKEQMEAARAMTARSDSDEEQDAYDRENFDVQPEPAPKSIFEEVRQSSNPFERLEQMLTGQFSRENQVPPPYESMKVETMEETVDEEEQILEDIRKRNEEKPEYLTEDESETESVVSAEMDGKGLPEMFKNLDEIKKAVIYSEILNRKY